MGDPAGRRNAGTTGGCPGDLGHESRSGPGGTREALSGGPVLPDQRIPHQDSAPGGAPRGYPVARVTLHLWEQRKVGQAGTGDRPKCLRVADVVPVAGKCAGIAERDRARGGLDPGWRQHHDRISLRPDHGRTCPACPAAQRSPLAQRGGASSSESTWRRCCVRIRGMRPRPPGSSGSAARWCNRRSKPTGSGPGCKHRPLRAALSAERHNPQTSVECLNKPQTLSRNPVLRGFVLDLGKARQR